jgi:asparagine synthase (glutamine-hydrolysing)
LKQKIISNDSETVSIALSGGIDSSLMLAILKKTFPEKKIQAISIKFANSLDETKIAEKIANKFDIDHKIIFLENYLQDLPKAISIVGLPFWDLHWFYVAKVVQNYSKYIITGDGGDEIFAGYTFRYEKYLSLVNENTASLQKVKSYISCHERDWVPDQEKLFAKNSNFQWENIYKLLLPYFENTLPLLEQVYLADYNGKLLYNFSIVSKSINNFYNLSSVTPLLNDELISYGTHLPSHQKYDQISNIGKIPLRKLIKKFDLESLMSDKKMGFSVSTKNLWDSHGQKICKDFLLDSRLVKDKWINQEWITKYINSKNLDVRYVNKFFGLLAFEIWYRIFVTNEMNPNIKLE